MKVENCPTVAQHTASHSTNHAYVSLPNPRPAPAAIYLPTLFKALLLAFTALAGSGAYPGRPPPATRLVGRFLPDAST